jgi:hypothetical protein
LWFLFLERILDAERYKCNISLETSSVLIAARGFVDMVRWAVKRSACGRPYVLQSAARCIFLASSFKLRTEPNCGFNCDKGSGLLLYVEITLVGWVATDKLWGEVMNYL